jgi:hypothetical protein
VEHDQPVLPAGRGDGRAEVHAVGVAAEGAVEQRALPERGLDREALAPVGIVERREVRLVRQGGGARQPGLVEGAQDRRRAHHQVVRSSRPGARAAGPWRASPRG